MQELLSLDQEMLLAINGIHTPVLDLIMYWLSNKIVWIPAYLLFAILLYRKYGLKPFLILLVMVGLGILASDQISSSLLKPFIARLRPCHEPMLTGQIYMGDWKCGGQFGFVSSHASNFAFLASFLFAYLGRKLRWISIGFTLCAILVGLSRVYLGVHYPGDVVAGYLLGIVVCLFSVSIQRYLIPDFSGEIQIRTD